MRWFALTLVLALTGSCSNDVGFPRVVEGAERSLTLVAEGASAVVDFTPAPELGELFAVTGRLDIGEPAPGVEFVKIDVRMPSHGHGMLTEPVARLGEAGAFSAEGLKLHMFGEWQLILDVRLADRTTLRLQRDFVFEPEGVHGETL